MMNSRADSFVFIVHGDANARQLLSDSLNAAGIQLTAFDSGESFLAAHNPATPGCVVMNLHLPQMTGIDVLQALADQRPHRPVIVLANEPTAGEVIDAFRRGATDVWIQTGSHEHLVRRVQAALASDLPRRRHYGHWLDVQRRMERLTPPEVEVVQLLTEGLLNKQIAARLNVAVRTIELRRANIFRKMEVASLGDLLRLVIFLEIYAQGTLND